jgi:hypothetical protein
MKLDGASYIDAASERLKAARTLYEQCRYPEALHNAITVVNKGTLQWKKK